MMISKKELIEHAKVFLENNYPDVPLEIPVVFGQTNDDWLGMYSYPDKENLKEKHRIVIKKDIQVAIKKELVYKVLEHELVHYSLHMLGLPHLDGDEYFRKEIRRLGTYLGGEIEWDEFTKDLRILK